MKLQMFSVVLYWGVIYISFGPMLYRLPHATHKWKTWYVHKWQILYIRKSVQWMCIPSAAHYLNTMLVLLVSSKKWWKKWCTYLTLTALWYSYNLHLFLTVFWRFLNSNRPDSVGIYWISKNSAGSERERAEARVWCAGEVLCGGRGDRHRGAGALSAPDSLVRRVSTHLHQLITLKIIFL
jgi:hypothetical protein